MSPKTICIDVFGLFSLVDAFPEICVCTLLTNKLKTSTKILSKKISNISNFMNKHDTCLIEISFLELIPGGKNARNAFMIIAKFRLYH